MIVGLIPLLLAMGVGAHGNRTLGASAIGGMLGVTKIGGNADDRLLFENG